MATIGQVEGPFEANINVLPIEGKMILGVSIPEKERMVYESDQDLGFYFKLNGESIKIGKSGMYEMDTPMEVSSCTFPKGAPKGTIIEYRMYEEI